jgi:hypothetical protein
VNVLSFQLNVGIEIYKEFILKKSRAFKQAISHDHRNFKEI